MTNRHAHDPACGCGNTPEDVDFARRRLLASAGIAAVGAMAATEAVPRPAMPIPYRSYPQGLLVDLPGRG